MTSGLAPGAGPPGLRRMGGTPEQEKRLSLGDRLLDWRDRLMGSTRFRHWAAGFPLTRPFAHRDAERLFDLCAGFVYSQVLAAAVRLQLFDHLAEHGPCTAKTLAPHLALDEASATRLLNAAVSLRLAGRRSRGRYGLGPLGAVLRTEPGIQAMVLHHEMLYQDLRDPVAMLRGEACSNHLASYWAYAGSERPGELPATSVGSYSDLMALSQRFIAQEVLDAYPVARHRRLMDVGGGLGGFIEAVARVAPRVELTLFDLPEVAKAAEERLLQVPGFPGASFAGGDFFRDELPKGADLISLVRIVHDHDDGPVLELLKRCREALLPANGRLLVAEPMAGDTHAARAGDAYFGFYLLAMGSGRPRTEHELCGLLAEAGFGRVKSAKTRNPLLASVLLADVR